MAREDKAEVAHRHTTSDIRGGRFPEGMLPSGIVPATEAAQAAADDAQAAADVGIANAATALARADSKAVTYFQTTMPTGQVPGDLGDLWFDSNDGYKMYSYSGAAWVATPDARISTALTNAATAQTAAGTAQTTANSKITTFYQTAMPTATTVGDLWVDTDDGNKLYRAGAVGAASWVGVRDTTIAAAQAAAVAAQGTADTAVTSANGKNKITWSTAAASGSGVTAGDTWFRTASGIIIGQWNWSGSAWVVATIGTTTIANLDAGKITTGALAAGTTITAGDPEGSRIELDSAGLRKYATDGTTVQVDLTGPTAVFSGVVTGSEIVGGTLRTGDSGQRVEIGTPTGVGRIMFYTGLTGEVSPARIQAISGGTFGRVTFAGGEITGKRSPTIWLDTDDDSLIHFQSDRVWINQGNTSISVLRIGGDAIGINAVTLEKLVGYDASEYLTRRVVVVADAAGRAAFVTAYTDPEYGRTVSAAAPLFIWQADESAGAQLQYTVDGTTFVTIGGGGGGTTLFADPNADRIAFWDDSAGAFAALTASTGLTLAGTDLSVRSATLAQTGIVELATQAETLLGTDETRAVTPAGVKFHIDERIAWVGAAGIVELATSAEAVTGTDTARAVTPAGVKAAIYEPGAAGTGVAYEAGWADYGGAYSPATWYKDKDGFIRLSGLLKRTGATFTGVTGAIFTLPVGARPVGNETFIMNKQSVDVVFCSVGSNGIVQVAATNTWTQNTSFMYLGGCQFRAA